MIKKDTAAKAWIDVLRYVLKEGEDFLDKDNKNCREKTNIKVMINNPKKDITKPIETMSRNPKWVYPRQDEIANITLSRNYIPGHMYVYGNRIFNYRNSINQINDFIIPLLMKDTTTRRAVINIWNPEIDSNIFNKEVPSIMLISFIVKDDRLNVTATIRSNDIFFGLPSNIYQIYLIQEYVAQRIEKDIGNMTLNLLSAHIFHEQFSDAEELINK